MPVINLWFRQGALDRGGHLGGSKGDCESLVPPRRLLDTVQPSPSSDNLDFRAAQNAIVIARKGRDARAPPSIVALIPAHGGASPPKVLFVPLVGAISPDA